MSDLNNKNEGVAFSKTSVKKMFWNESTDCGTRRWFMRSKTTKTDRKKLLYVFVTKSERFSGCLPKNNRIWNGSKIYEKSFRMRNNAMFVCVYFRMGRWSNIGVGGIIKLLDNIERIGFGLWWCFYHLMIYSFYTLNLTFSRVAFILI